MAVTTDDSTREATGSARRTPPPLPPGALRRIIILYLVLVPPLGVAFYWLGRTLLALSARADALIVGFAVLVMTVGYWRAAWRVLHRGR